MASQYTKVKTFTGVYYSESKVNKYHGRPERTYWINFKDTTGKLRWERCGKTSEGWTPEAAQRKRHKILEEDRVGCYKPRSQRKKDMITFDQFMTTYYLPWSNQNQKHPSDDQSRYSTWIKNELANLSLSQITREHVEHIIQRMREAGRADATINHIVKLVRHVFNKAIEWQKWNGTNPCQFIKLATLNNARSRHLSKVEANLLISELQAISPQTASMATFSLYCGMRLSEILNLRWKDINTESGIITILDTKNYETTNASITEPIKLVLETLTAGQPDEYIFTSTKETQVRYLSNTFSRVVEKLGFNDGISDRRQRVTFHTLRHTFTSWAIMSGVPLFLVSKAIGHKTTTMTERYSHLAPDSQCKAFEAVASFNITKSK